MEYDPGLGVGFVGKEHLFRGHYRCTGEGKYSLVVNEIG
jgi:hypothetical protein